jgi:hypothetical protein
VWDSSKLLSIEVTLLKSSGSSELNCLNVSITSAYFPHDFSVLDTEDCLNFSLIVIFIIIIYDHHHCHNHHEG